MNYSSSNYSRPFVPSHYTKQTVERMPYDAPCYLPVDYDDMFDSPVFFVDDYERLRIERSTELDEGVFDSTRSPLGRIGIMRCLLVDGYDSLQDVYIADLRFLGSYQLDRFDDMIGSLDNDQESYMENMELLNTALRFDGLIAAEVDTECDKANIPKGVLYGDERLYPVLKKLRKFGSHAMREHFAEEKKQEAEAAKQDKRSRAKSGKKS